MARRLAPLIAVGVVALVAMIAAVAGPVQVGEPIIPFEVRSAEPSPQPTFEADEEEPEDEDVPANPFTVGIVLYTVIVGIAGVTMATVLVVWVVRWLLSRERAGRGPRGPDPKITVAALRDAAELAVFEAEAARPGEASDVVVACWVILEQAAASAGTPREAPQTPTEFTAAVLADHHADQDAVASLLSLYHEARFGRAALPDEAASTAAAALRTISVSLSQSAAAPRDAP
ncbi:MAG TPA: DUF4129 domain-containing protein [Jiangellaceae bacterium]|nr:DUF4129 domain-containing protein [Jiangellaceae bacterium]